MNKFDYILVLMVIVGYVLAFWCMPIFLWGDIFGSGILNVIAYHLMTVSLIAIGKFILYVLSESNYFYK